MLDTEFTLPFYADRSGAPLQNGAAYFGLPGQNPVTSPVIIYWDAAGTQPAAQPIVISGGMPMRNGTPSRIWVTGDFSRLVLDSKGRQIFYETAQPNRIPSAFGLSTGASIVGCISADPNAVANDLQSKTREIVSILDDMTLQQRADARSGALTLDLTVPIQNALTYLAGIGGGALEWYDAKVTGTLVYQGSNLVIRPRGGNQLVQAGNVFNTFRIYPTSLDSIWDGTGRPVGFANGIEGAPELLMYENNDANRLHDITIQGLNYTNVGPGSGRFVDAFSVDRMRLIGNTAVTTGNTATVWYCRGATTEDNDFTCGAGAFPLFYFKSYGLVKNNDLRNGFNGFDAKGCYPQPGKTTLQPFDVAYQFWNPVKAVDNRIYNASNFGMQAGYYLNSAADISDTIVTGVTKSQWYGQVWGAEYVDNTIVYNVGVPGVGTVGINMNINAKYAKVRGNLLYSVGIFVECSDSIDIENNTILSAQATSTAAINVQGGTFGAGTRNATDIRVRRNTIVGTQAGQASIRLRGADHAIVEENFIRDGSIGTNDILIDSTASATTSTGNHVLRNTIIKAAADFAYPFKSTGADGTVFDQNRAYGGWFSGNALDSDGFADAHYKRGIVSADTPTSMVGAPGTCSVGQNFGDQNTAAPEPGYANGMAVNGIVGGGWRQPILLGGVYYWTETPGAGGRFRTKATRPTGDTDGGLVGAQA